MNIQDGLEQARELVDQAELIMAKAALAAREAGSRDVSRSLSGIGVQLGSVLNEIAYQQSRVAGRPVDTNAA